MPEFVTKRMRITAEQWPHCGMEVLQDLVGPERLIVANDGTPYVITLGGHPVRVQNGWWVHRDLGGGLAVVAEVVRSDWEIVPGT